MANMKNLQAIGTGLVVLILILAIGGLVIQNIQTATYLQTGVTEEEFNATAYTPTSLAHNPLAGVSWVGKYANRNDSDAYTITGLAYTDQPHKINLTTSRKRMLGTANLTILYQYSTGTETNVTVNGVKLGTLDGVSPDTFTNVSSALLAGPENQLVILYRSDVDNVNITNSSLEYNYWITQTPGINWNATDYSGQIMTDETGWYAADYVWYQTTAPSNVSATGLSAVTAFVNWVPILVIAFVASAVLMMFLSGWGTRKR